MNIFSFIKERVAILDVINEYVTLKRAGGYHKGTCPFHHEKTASFTVSPDKHIFYCFGCHLSGDVISFIAKIENCSQKDAAQLLAEKYSLELPHNFSFESTEKETEYKNHYFSICKAVATWCHEQFLKNHPAQSYFQRREFTSPMFTYFDIGYFPSGNAAISDLLYAMKRQSILAHDLIDAGILAEGRTSFYSPFEDRLIFPIKDILGRYCGFGGRTFKDHDTRPKYYNSRESDYFIKGSLLFNLDKAKKSIQETGKIFLVEGYTDCMAMTQHGIPNTVATLGTACTLEHLKQLARYAEHIFIVYDSDHAGRAAILRLAELSWQVNLELKVITLPDGDDPASFLRNKGDFNSLITIAEDIFHFFLGTMGHNFLSKSLSQKMNTIRSFLTVISTIGDSLKKDMLLQRASKIFDIPFDSLKNELEHGAKKTADPQITNLPVAAETSSISLLEKRIFCAIMNNIQLLEEENKFQFVQYLPSPLREILVQLKDTKEKSETVTFSYFFDRLNECDKQYISKMLLEMDDPIDTAAFDKLLEQLQKKQWKNIVQTIKIQLTQAKQEGNHTKAALILQDFMQLQNRLKNF